MDINANQVNFTPSKVTALLTVPSSDVDIEAVQACADNFDLLLKSEFHITLIGFAVGRQLQVVIQRLPKHMQLRALELLEEIIRGEYSWCYKLSSDLFYIEKLYTFSKRPNETRRSIIQLVECEDMKRLYAYLADVFQVALDEPFPHITLCTNSTNQQNKMTGIGIATRSEFETLGPRPVTL